MGYKVIPRWVNMKVGEENELPDHAFIYYVAGAGNEEIQALIFEPATDDDALKAKSADFAWHFGDSRIK